MKFIKLKFPFRRKKAEKNPVKEDSSVEYVFRKLNETRERLSEEGERRSVIMGIGNDLNGDDGIGWYVVEKLRKSLVHQEGIHFIKVSVPEDHVSEVRDFSPDVLIMIDSADFKGGPGDVRLVGEKEVAHTIGGTHTTPVTLFLKLLTEESEIFSPKIVFIGIQPKQTNFGTPLSKEVKRSGDKVAELIEGLCKGGMLEKEIEEKIISLTTKNPLKRVPGIVEKLTEAGKAKKE